MLVVLNSSRCACTWE